MSKQTPGLQQKVASALGDGKITSSNDLQALIGEVKAAIDEADKRVEQERDTAIDFLTSDANEARQRVAAAELKRNRYKAAFPRLQDKLAEALRTEYAEGKVEAKTICSFADIARCAELNWSIELPNNKPEAWAEP